MPGTHEIYNLHFMRKDDKLRIAAVQVFGERTDLVLRLRLPLVHGEITIDIKPARLDGSARFKDWKTAFETVGAEYYEVPKSTIEIERIEGDPQPDSFAFKITQKTT